jgi:lipid-A-disaccharide synthase
MRPKRIMLIAGEASSDALASELVLALRQCIPDLQSRPTADVQPLTAPLPVEFFGAGGPRMAQAGVALACDMTQHAVIGLSDALKKIGTFRRIQRDLLRLAIERQPDVIILVDSHGFNGRFARAIRNVLSRQDGTFLNWTPRIVQFVSPQVWASRPQRANRMAHDIDLLLCLFEFEKRWYAERVPQLRVEWVGHPIVDRHASRTLSTRPAPFANTTGRVPLVLLLPGSRPAELKRHIPVMLDSVRRIASSENVRFKMVLPTEELLALARPMIESGVSIAVQVGQIEDALSEAAVVITKTGTVTLECACFGVPTVALYIPSWTTYQIARRIVTVKYLSMPNLLADEAIFPEFIANNATGENIAREALDLLRNTARRDMIKAKLANVVAQLGPPGAAQRAAEAILRLMGETWDPDLRAGLTGEKQP